MGIRIKFTVLFLLAAFSALTAYDYLEEPMVIPSSRSAAMGGGHAADSSDMAVLFNNPGSFQTVDTQMAFSEFTLGLKGPVFDIADLVVSAMSGGTAVEDLLAADSTMDLISGLYAGFNLVGPVYFGYVGNGLGLGFFNNTDVQIMESSPLTLEAAIREDILLCGGYTYRLPLSAEWDQTLDVGVLLKGGVRGTITVTQSYAQLLALDISADTLTTSPFDFTAAIGLDLGVLYQYRDIFSVGLTALDIFTPTTRKRYIDGIGEMFGGTVDPAAENGVVPFTLNLGLAFTPHLGFLDSYVTGILLLLDYKDILGFWLYPEDYLNPWLHLSAGAEVTLLDIFSLRCGLNAGLFSAGFGTDLKLFTMNVSLFGTELGSEPGVRPVYNLMIGFEFRT